MDDRELLELAATAAGIDYWLVRFGPRSAPVEKLHITANGETVEWDPLISDELAFRLAVKLEMELDCHLRCASVHQNIWQNADDIEDDEAAMRRAIVRAAAEIGKTM